MNQPHRRTAANQKTVWKLQPLVRRSRKTAHAGDNATTRESAEAEYFASVSVWGGLNHRLSEFLDSDES